MPTRSDPSPCAPFPCPALVKATSILSAGRHDSLRSGLCLILHLLQSAILHYSSRVNFYLFIYLFLKSILRHSAYTSPQLPTRRRIRPHSPRRHSRTSGMWPCPRLLSHLPVRSPSRAGLRCLLPEPSPSCLRESARAGSFPGTLCPHVSRGFPFPKPFSANAAP